MSDAFAFVQITRQDKPCNFFRFTVPWGKCPQLSGEPVTQNPPGQSDGVSSAVRASTRKLFSRWQYDFAPCRFNTEDGKGIQITQYDFAT
jgi:hypothetical protein